MILLSWLAWRLLGWWVSVQGGGTQWGELWLTLFLGSSVHYCLYSAFRVDWHCAFPQTHFQQNEQNSGCFCGVKLVMLQCFQSILELHVLAVSCQIYACIYLIVNVGWIIVFLFSSLAAALLEDCWKWSPFTCGFSVSAKQVHFYSFLCFDLT